MLNLNSNPQFDPMEDAGLHLKMFVLYEDHDSIVRAKTLRFELARRCRAEIAIDEDYWNFGLLSHPRLRLRAASEAANADMLIISSRGTTGMPSYFKTWIEQWSATKEPGFAALVAVIDPQAIIAGEALVVPGSLREIAEKAGIAFFCNAQEEPDLRHLQRGMESRIPTPRNCSAPRPIRRLYPPVNRVIPKSRLW